MKPAEIRNLISYDEWANQRVLAAVDGLTDEQYAAPVVSSFSSVNATLMHLIAAEWLWLNRWRGNSPAAPPDWLKELSRERARTRLAEVERERRAFLDSITEEQLDGIIDYRNLAGEPGAQRLADLILHLVNHSTYHRGQLVTMLRQLGATPPSTDLLLFNRAQSSELGAQGGSKPSS